MNNDLISREALKKHIAEIFEVEEKYDKKWAMGLKYSLKLIDNAPTVGERPIHCKDCKYTVLSKDGKTLICCMTMKIGTVKPNFYCGNGEMKGGKV